MDDNSQSLVTFSFLTNSYHSECQVAAFGSSHRKPGVYNILSITTDPNDGRDVIFSSQFMSLIHHLANFVSQADLVLLWVCTLYSALTAFGEHLMTSLHTQ